MTRTVAVEMWEEIVRFRLFFDVEVTYSGNEMDVGLSKRENTVDS